jgi:hypothetical protein
MAMSNEEWEQVEQDMPKMDDPFLVKYLQGREALIAEEAKRRSGEFRLTHQSRISSSPVNTTITTGHPISQYL